MKYRIRRYSNARAEKRCYVEAANEGAARHGLEMIDWSTISEHAFEPADMGDEDVLIDIECQFDPADEFELLAEGIRDHNSLPYSWEAVALVKRLASIVEKDMQTGDDVAHHFWKFYREAKALIGDKPC